MRWGLTWFLRWLAYIIMISGSLWFVFYPHRLLALYIVEKQHSLPLRQRRPILKNLQSVLVGRFCPYTACPMHRFTYKIIRHWVEDGESVWVYISTLKYITWEFSRLRGLALPCSKSATSLWSLVILSARATTGDRSICHQWVKVGCWGWRMGDFVEKIVENPALRVRGPLAKIYITPFISEVEDHQLPLLFKNFVFGILIL